VRSFGRTRFSSESDLVVDDALHNRGGSRFFEASLNRKFKTSRCFATARARKLKFKTRERNLVGSYKYTVTQIREIDSKMFSIITRMAFLMGHVLPGDRPSFISGSRRLAVISTRYFAAPRCAPNTTALKLTTSVRLMDHERFANRSSPC